MYGIMLTIHVIVSLLLVIVVLLQSGKSADLAGAFGGMGSQSTFGPRGAATFLSKLTTTLAILFMVTSLSLWIIAANREEATTVVEDVKQEQTQTVSDTPTSTKTETNQTTPPAATTTDDSKTTGQSTTKTEKDATQDTQTVNNKTKDKGEEKSSNPEPKKEGEPKNK